MDEGRMHLGLSSYAYRWAFGNGDFRPREPMTAEALIEAADAAGLSAVQLCDNVPFTGYSFPRLRSIRALASSLGIRIETGTRGAEPSVLRKALDASSELGSGLLRVVVEIDRGGDVPAQLAEAARKLHSLTVSAEEHSILLAIENHATVTSSDLIRLLQDVGSDTCGACIDTMNSVLLIEQPEETVRALAPFALSVHLKDFRIVKLPDCFRIEGTALGDGQLDLPSIVEQVCNRGRPHSFHAELYIERRGDEPATLEWERYCVARSAAVLKELLPRASSLT